MFVFFALSGFLITALLVEERSTTGRVSLKNFFARRALRLLPALGFFLAGWFAVVLAMRGHALLDDHGARRRHGSGNVPPGRPRGGGRRAHVHDELGRHTGMVLGVRAARAPVVPRRGGAVLSPVGAGVGPDTLLPLAGRSEVGSRTGRRRLVHRRRVPRRARNVARARHEHRHTGGELPGRCSPRGWPGRNGLGGCACCTDGDNAITLVGCILFLVWGSWVFRHAASRPVFTLTWVAVSAAAGLMVVALIGEGSGRRSGLVSSPVVTFVGRRSYGLYLWHYVWLTWLARIGLLGVPLALAATFASAEVSWRLVERPALVRKHRFTSTPPRQPAREPGPTPVGPVPASSPLAITVGR